MTPTTTTLGALRTKRKPTPLIGSEADWLTSALDAAHFASIQNELYLDDLDGLFNDATSPEANRCPLAAE